MTFPSKPGAGIELSQDQRIAWLRLSRSEKVGPATFIELIKRYGTAARALAELPDLARRSSRGAISIPSVEAAEAELHQIAKMGGHTVCLGEPAYPAALRATDSPPPVLTVLGNLDSITGNNVAIVGSRNASLSGVKFARELAGDLG
ncbi:MAG: DNA-processing protein DprA, partial [Rhizobiaceae bacterium]